MVVPHDRLHPFKLNRRSWVSAFRVDGEPTRTCSRIPDKGKAAARRRPGLDECGLAHRKRNAVLRKATGPPWIESLPKGGSDMTRHLAPMVLAPLVCVVLIGLSLKFSD